MSAVLAADGDRAWFDVRAGCNSDASGRGPCYMDLVFNSLVLGHAAKIAGLGQLSRVRWQIAVAAWLADR